MDHSSRDPLHVTYFEAPYILPQLRNTERMCSMSNWTFTDVFEENGPGALSTTAKGEATDSVAVSGGKIWLRAAADVHPGAEEPRGSSTVRTEKASMKSVNRVC